MNYITCVQHVLCGLFFFYFDTEIELTEMSVAQFATGTPVTDWPIFGLGLIVHK